MHIVRIARHPTEPEIACAYTPIELATVMGGFGPARRSPALNCYLIPIDQLDAFTRYLSHHDARTVDERGIVQPTDESTALGPLPNCRHCGQPTRRRQKDDPSKEHPPPIRCPACGELWDPVIIKVVGADLHAEQTCDVCGHTQRGRFAYCSACGVEMQSPLPKPLPPPRTKLDDPVPIAETIPGTINEIVRAGANPE